MLTFTLLEEHSENLEFCSPGNSQVKHPFFYFLCFPMDSQALGHAELSVSLTLWQGEGKPLRNQRPQSGKAPLLRDVPPSPTRARSCRICCCTLGTLEPFQLWLGLGQAGFRGSLLHSMVGGLARSRASLPVTLT